VIVTDGTAVVAAGAGSDGIDSGTAAGAVGFAGAGAAVAITTAGGDGRRVGSAVRFVTVRAAGFLCASVGIDGLAIGGAMAGVAGAAGVGVLAGRIAASTARGCDSVSGECSPGLDDGCRGVATVAITSTAAAAASVMCRRVGCQGIVDGCETTGRALGFDPSARGVVREGPTTGGAVGAVGLTDRGAG
jgi:hypothetical protein